MAITMQGCDRDPSRSQSLVISDDVPVPEHLPYLSELVLVELLNTPWNSSRWRNTWIETGTAW
jgi:hypothetical protein